MNLWRRVLTLLRPAASPRHIAHGAIGERAARRHLEDAGLRFLAANFRSKRGEIDLVMRDGATLVFVEVKARSEGAWLRPAAAVNARKKRRLSRAAMDYLRKIRQPLVPVRFDIVEVILQAGMPGEIRHLPNAFPLARPYRFG